MIGATAAGAFLCPKGRGNLGWIEYHFALRDHWKIQRLGDTLKINYAQALGHISCLWCWAGEFAQNGQLNKFTEDEICFAAKWNGAKKDFIGALKTSELLNDDFSIHDWKKHGIRLILSSRKRIRKFRDKQHVGNDTETLQKRPSFSLSNLSNLSYLSSLIPPDLAESRLDIETWFAYKRERRESFKSRRGLEAFWNKLRGLDAARRKAAIEYSMAQNWVGLYEEKGGQNGNRPTNKIVGDAAPEPGKYSHLDKQCVR